MPAASSSQADPVIGHLVDLAGEPGKERPGLLAALGQVADPRRRRGVRHRLVVIMVLAVCAVLAGARSYAAIAEWAADAGEDTLARLGVAGRVPSESTIRRVLQRLDAEAFDVLAGRWAAQRTTPQPGKRRLIAVDGKTLRGAAHAGQDGPHLLAALDHTHGAVLGQVEVGAKTNEIPLFTTLLDRIDISGAVVTADALHAQRDHARYLHGRGAHYLITVKGNQPSLFTQLKNLPWQQVPMAHESGGRGHGRDEHRTIKVTSVASGLLFPHAAQAIQIRRRRRRRGTKKWSTETSYAITSLGFVQARAIQLAAIIRGHWKIENELHWVRDMTFDEDRSQTRTATGPRIMASLRNLVITILRLGQAPSIATALRYHARHPSRPLQTIMKCLGLCRGPDRSPEGDSNDP
jgi:predicted transposase YbfD/YdcC/urease gamma subunit